MTNPEPRVLIMGAPFGTGNTQAAVNIANAFNAISPHAHVQAVESIIPRNSLSVRLASSAYSRMIDLAPGLFGHLYNGCDRKIPFGAVARLFFPTGPRHAIQVLREFRPDLVIATHPFPNLSWPLKRVLARERINFTICVAFTDFSGHAAWITPEIDYYLVASEPNRSELIEAGVPFDRVYVTGIPIAGEYGEKIDKTAARRVLGLSRQLPVLLVSGGGMGMGPFTGILKSLEETEALLQVIVATGNNHALQRILEPLARQSRHNVKVLGYTRQMRTIMCAADLMISKAGGLTCAEALALELPLIILNPIPGQEERNADFLVRHGLAFQATNVNAAARIIDDFARDYRQRDERQPVLPGWLLPQVREFGNGKASIDIAGLMMSKMMQGQLAGESYSCARDSGLSMTGY